MAGSRPLTSFKEKVIMKKVTRSAFCDTTDAACILLNSTKSDIDHINNTTTRN